MQKRRTRNLHSALYGMGKALLLTSVLFGSAPDTMAESLAAKITGTVERVDENGIMWLEDTLQGHTAPVPIREWALEIDPAKMELLSLGRRVTCTLFYSIDDVHIAECVLEFRPKVESNPLKEPFERKSISYLADQFGLGVRGCSEEEKQNEPQGVLHIKLCENMGRGVYRGGN